MKNKTDWQQKNTTCMSDTSNVRSAAETWLTDECPNDAVTCVSKDDNLHENEADVLV